MRESRDFLGWASIKKLSGDSTGVSAGTQINIPSALVMPRNPNNVGYMPSINAQNSVSLKVVGKKTPSVALSTYVKSTWFTAGLLKSLILDIDSDYDTDVYSLGVNDGTTTRVWDSMRCNSITLSQAAEGGPISCDIGFTAIYGENEAAVPTTYTTATGDCGSLVDVAHVDFGASGSVTADYVKGWTLSIIRPQGYVFEIDGTLYAADTISGMLGGALTLTQSPNATVSPSAAATIRIFTAGAVPSGTGVKLDMVTSLDEYIRDHRPTFGTTVRSYTLIDLCGANAITAASF